jgi:hypothetical protein
MSLNLSARSKYQLVIRFTSFLRRGQNHCKTCRPEVKTYEFLSEFKVCFVASTGQTNPQPSREMRAWSVVKHFAWMSYMRSTWMGSPSNGIRFISRWYRTMSCIRYGETDARIHWSDICETEKEEEGAKQAHIYDEVGDTTRVPKLSRHVRTSNRYVGSSCHIRRRRRTRTVFAKLLAYLRSMANQRTRLFKIKLPFSSCTEHNGHKLKQQP